MSSRLCQSHKMYLLALFGHFTDRNDISLLFHILQLVKSMPFHTAESWKRYPFRGGANRISHCREYPLPPGGWYSSQSKPQYTCSSFRADKFPMVWIFCARTRWPIPRDHDMVRILGRICSTGTVHDTRSGYTQCVMSWVDWSLFIGTGRR